MEEYKIQMINEAYDVDDRIHMLSKKIDRFSEDYSFDPIELALMKQQLAHMKDYFMTLILRCQMTFSQNEFEKLSRAIDGNSEDKANV